MLADYCRFHATCLKLRPLLLCAVTRRPKLPAIEALLASAAALPVSMAEIGMLRSLVQVRQSRPSPTALWLYFVELLKLDQRL